MPWTTTHFASAVHTISKRLKQSQTRALVLNCVVHESRVNRSMYEIWSANLFHCRLLFQRKVAHSIVDELVEIKLVLSEKLERTGLASKALVKARELPWKDVEVVSLCSVLSVAELESGEPELTNQELLSASVHLHASDGHLAAV